MVIDMREQWIRWRLSEARQLLGSIDLTVLDEDLQNAVQIAHFELSTLVNSPEVK